MDRSDGMDANLFMLMRGVVAVGWQCWAAPSQGHKLGVINQGRVDIAVGGGKNQGMGVDPGNPHFVFFDLLCCQLIGLVEQNDICRPDLVVGDIRRRKGAIKIHPVHEGDNGIKANDFLHLGQFI